MTLTTTCRFEKRNFMMHVNILNRTAILVKLGHILWRKRLLVFPLMSYDTLQKSHIGRVLPQNNVLSNSVIKPFPLNI